MNRCIETRLKRLEAALPLVESQRRSHLVAVKTGQTQDDAIAELVTTGAAGPDDLFIVLVSGQPDPNSATRENF
jgi:hypothetical protein